MLGPPELVAQGPTGPFADWGPSTPIFKLWVEPRPDQLSARCVAADGKWPGDDLAGGAGVFHKIRLRRAQAPIQRWAPPASRPEPGRTAGEWAPSKPSRSPPARLPASCVGDRATTRPPHVDGEAST